MRVRYTNPLPAPPCPPKLLDIPTDHLRYARPEFLNDIASETPLPMIIDAECGMPLDLGQFECLWEQDADDSGVLGSANSSRPLSRASAIALNPNPDNLPPLDPKDQFLLLEPTSTPGIFTSNSFANTPGSGTSTPTALPHVPWLRKTEYLSSRDASRSALIPESYVYRYLYTSQRLNRFTEKISPTLLWTFRMLLNYEI